MTDPQSMRIVQTENIGDRVKVDVSTFEHRGTVLVWINRGAMLEFANVSRLCLTRGAARSLGEALIKAADFADEIEPVSALIGA